MASSSPLPEQFHEIALVGAWPETRLRLARTVSGEPHRYETRVWNEEGTAPAVASARAGGLTELIREGSVGMASL